MQITGTLQDAIAQPLADTQLRITPTINDSEVKQAAAYVTTGSDGSYDFTLAKGRYSIEINYYNPNSENEEFELLGEVSVPDSVASLTIAGLFSAHTYTAPVPSPEFPERQV